MKRSALTALIIAAVLACAAPLSAHEKYRVVGTVVKITAAQINVKQIKDNAVLEIDIDKKTKVTRDNKPVAFSQIKVGGSVVVDGLGDDIFGLQAIEIRLVPSIPADKKPQ
jgi:hypothetical protein